MQPGNADGINEEELARAWSRASVSMSTGIITTITAIFTITPRRYVSTKKTFASKQQVIEQTPDPAVRDMLLRMQELGIDTVFDRFDAQQPQCSFIAGICCKNCFGGPCKITKKAPRGVWVPMLT